MLEPKTEWRRKEPPKSLRLFINVEPEWKQYYDNYWGAWVQGDHLEHWPSKNQFRFRRRTWVGQFKDTHK